MEPAALESVTRTRRRGILRFSAAGLRNRCCFSRVCGRFQPRRPLSAKRSSGYLQAFLHRLLLRLPVYIPILRQPMNIFILYLNHKRYASNHCNIFCHQCGCPGYQPGGITPRYQKKEVIL